jgi:hypothetical protein
MDSDRRVSGPRLSRAEQETIARWDEQDQTITLSTASPIVKRQLERKGYVWRADSPFGWRIDGLPREALQFRKLAGGRVVKRKGSATAFGHGPSRTIAPQGDLDGRQPPPRILR